jgi:ribonuclease J
MIIVVATVDGSTGKLLAGPDIISRGFVGIPDSARILEEAKRKVEEALLICEREAITDWMLLKSHVKDSLSRFLFAKTMRRPMIIPIIMEV